MKLLQGLLVVAAVFFAPSAAHAASTAFPEGVLFSSATSCQGGPEVVTPDIHTTCPTIRYATRANAGTGGMLCLSSVNFGPNAVSIPGTQALFNLENGFSDTGPNGVTVTNGFCDFSCVPSAPAEFTTDNPRGTYAFNGNRQNCPTSGQGEWVFYINSNAALDFRSRSFSIEMWVKGDDEAYEQMLLRHCPNGSAQNECMEIYQGNGGDDGKLKVRWGGPTNTVLTTDTSWAAGTNAGLDNNSWHYVVFVYDASTKIRQIYIDGEPRGQDNAPTGQHYLGAPANITINNDGYDCTNSGHRRMDGIRFTAGTPLSYAQIRSYYHGSNHFFTSGGALQNADSLNNYGCPAFGAGTYPTQEPVQVTVTANPQFSTSGNNKLDVRTMSVNERLRADTLQWNIVQTSLETPPAPRIDYVDTSWIHWNWDPTTFTPAQARYVCDASGGRTQYDQIRDGSSVGTTSSKGHWGFFASNTRHCLKINATYTDTGVGCSNAPVGPSADTAEDCRYTFAQVPTNPPVVNAGINGTSVNLTLDQTPNSDPTLMNVESDGTGSWLEVSGYAFVSPTARVASNLAKSARHFFRSRAKNGDGIQTNPSPVSVASYVTMPETPINFVGVPAPLPACPKTAIQWSWSPVIAGSGGSTAYTVRNNADTATFCTATSPTTNCNQTGLAPSAGGNQQTAKVYAADAGAPFPNSLFSTGYTASTASSLIPQIGTPVGTSISPGVQWDWTAPAYLCAGWTYQIVFKHAVLAPVTLPANSSPQYIQVPMPVNSKSVIQVRAFDPIDVTGSPLSGEATAYSVANPPTNLRALAISTSTLVVAWDANGNPGYTRYEADISPDGGVTQSPRVLLADNHTILYATMTALQAGHTYQVRVRAYNGIAGEPTAQPTAYVVGNFVMQTTAPYITGTPLSQTQVQWSWTHVGDAAYYELYDARTNTLMTTVTPPPPFPPTPMTYTQTIGAGNPNTRLSAYVWAYNAVGMANTSATAYAYTDPAVPGAATWLSVSSNSVTMQWGANGNPNPGTLYEMNISTDPFFGVVVATRTSLSLTGTVNELFPASTYYGRVRAYSGSGAISAFTAVPSRTWTTPSPFVTLSSSPASAYVPEGNVLGLWHFDDHLIWQFPGYSLNHSSSSDSSDHHNAARLQCTSASCVSTPTFTGGMPTLSTAVAFGGQVGSVAFIPYIPAYDALGSITVAAWVKPGTAAQPTDTTMVVREARVAGLDYALDLDNDVFLGTRFRFRVGASQVFAPASALTPGEWHRVVGVYDSVAGTISIYVNGVFQNVTPGVAARIARPDGHIYVGNRERNTSGWVFDRGFIGSIDEVKIAGQAWSGGEVSGDYSASFASTLTLSGVNAGVSLYLPPNAFGGLATIYASRDPINHPIVVEIPTLMNGLSVTPTGQLLVPNTLIEIVPAVGGLPFSGLLGSSATITMTYSDANGDGLLDGVSPPIAAHTLKMYTLDTTVVRWVQLPTVVDRNARTVTGTTPHFSVFALFGAATIGTNLSQVKIYPNPWRRGSEGKYDAQFLTFDNLPQSGTLRIFNLAGERVYDTPFLGTASGTVQWSGKNFNGHAVASGVYFAYVKGDGSSGTTVIKFAIER